MIRVFAKKSTNSSQFWGGISATNGGGNHPFQIQKFVDFKSWKVDINWHFQNRWAMKSLCPPGRLGYIGDAILWGSLSYNHDSMESKVGLFFAAQMCVPNIFVATTHQMMTILTQDHYHRISNEFATRLCQVCLRGLIWKKHLKQPLQKHHLDQPPPYHSPRSIYVFCRFGPWFSPSWVLSSSEQIR